MYGRGLKWRAGAVSLVALTALVLSFAGTRVTQAQSSTPPDAAALRAEAKKNLDSLKTVSIPAPQNLGTFVKDRAALRRLGKALFWEQQVGSDGEACASCHFHDGADNRSKNQLNPGFRRVAGADNTFGNNFFGVPAPAQFGPNYQLTTGDFPFHRLSDPDDRHSAVLSDTNDVVSSSGVFNAQFQATGIPLDQGTPVVGVFNVNGVMVRNVEPRNTPSSINAALNHRNFWDGRARKEFNGVNPFGKLDPGAHVVFAAGSVVKLVPVVIESLSIASAASTASQSVGPPLSDLEMSFAGRRFADLGRKILDPALQPLGQQLVAKDDSVLGDLSLHPGKGLKTGYLALVQAAIQPIWWNAPGVKVDLTSGSPVIVKTNAVGPNLFTVAEYNFSLFFGLAVAEYERTLISDDAPFDRFMEGNDAALSPEQQGGLQVFIGKGKCIACHKGPEFSGASLRNVQNELLERMIMGDDRVAVYDNGFYNIGTRPTADDIGVGGTAPSGLPLSNSRSFQNCVKERVAKGDLIPLANQLCLVPRIPARPLEAAKLLEKASAKLGQPPAVRALLDQAAATSDLCAASSLLGQARDAMAADPAATPEIKDLLVQATSLLPDPVFPGKDCSRLLGPFLRPDERVAVDGAFKTPILRNVELTAPYFHNGGQGALAQVVQFYDRGGDFAELNRDNLDPDIQDLGLTDEEKADLVAFLVSLTDERVRFDRAPFDHPSLNVPNGGTPGVTTTAIFGPAFPGVLDGRMEIPAVGAGGLGALGITPGQAGTPLANFPDPLQ